MRTMVAAALHYRCNIVAESPHREDCLKYHASYGYSNVTFSLHFCNETREDRIRQTSNQCSTALAPRNQPTCNRTRNRRINRLAARATNQRPATRARTNSAGTKHQLIPPAMGVCPHSVKARGFLVGCKTPRLIDKHADLLYLCRSHA